ncbi:MAG: hypothetical protein AAFQ67_07110 [Pseudomonadota bacterium]
MVQHGVFAALAGIALALVVAWTSLFPPPHADIELYYFGADDCGACVAWKRTDLQEWRGDPASVSTPLEISDLRSVRTHPFPRGYGDNTPIFAEAIGERRRWAYPTFVLVKNGEVKHVAQGADGWRKLERLAKANAARLND